MVLLGDETQVQTCFGTFGDSANLDGIRCTFCAERTTAQKLFWSDPMELLGDVGHLESHFGTFGDSASVGAR
jgi:hypothetical protein